MSTTMDRFVRFDPSRAAIRRLATLQEGFLVHPSGPQRTFRPWKHHEKAKIPIFENGTDDLASTMTLPSDVGGLFMASDVFRATSRCFLKTSGNEDEMTNRSNVDERTSVV